MESIIIECKSCKTKMPVDRTKEIPKIVTSMWCNWCPNCCDDVEDYYQEGYVYAPVVQIPDPVDPNQLELILKP